MRNGRIGVGIIGVQPDRSWAAIAHIPALQVLQDYEIVALSTTRQASADAAAQRYAVRRAYDNSAALVADPQVDLVVITVKVPRHLELVTAAVGAGKNVLCEWPLGNGLDEAVRMSEMAHRKGVLAVVGLQARASPAVNFVRDLVAEGYVGEVLSTTLVGSGMNWGAVMETSNLYTADKRNGATLLTIPFGHTVDALCHVLGEFQEVSATLARRRTHTTVAETGASAELTAEDQVIVAGTLSTGAVASVHYRGGMTRGTGLLWEINGTAGDLQLTAFGGHAQMFDLAVQGASGQDKSMQTLEIPGKYRWVPQATGLSVNVAQAYARLASDLRSGTRLCPTFNDAVVRHRLLDAVEASAKSGARVAIAGA